MDFQSTVGGNGKQKNKNKQKNGLLLHPGLVLLVPPTRKVLLLYPAPARHSHMVDRSDELGRVVAYVPVGPMDSSLRRLRLNVRRLIFFPLAFEFFVQKAAQQGGHQLVQLRTRSRGEGLSSETFHKSREGESSDGFFGRQATRRSTIPPSAYVFKARFTPRHGLLGSEGGGGGE